MGLKLFKIFGIEIKLHISWWIIFALIAWSLATGYFPAEFAGQTTKTYWLMGIASSLLLFISVLLHELSHSLVARLKNIKVDSITLFFFGGVAGISQEKMKPTSEFLMAISGPLFSLVLGGLFYLVNLYTTGIVGAITSYLYQLNIILAIFNLVPAYPLDGGRAFRAILHGYYKDLTKATRIAAAAGRGFAIFLVVIGIYGLVSGTGNGLWLILLGGFLYFIARVSYDQVLMQDTLSGVMVGDLVTTPIVLKGSMKFGDFLKKYLKSDEDVFIVKEKGFVGVLDVGKVSGVSSELTLAKISVPLHQFKKLTSKDSVFKAFRMLAEYNIRALPVGKKLITRKSIERSLILQLNQKGKSARILAGKVQK